jgi:uncharacterized cupin superfamily protein
MEPVNENDLEWDDVERETATFRRKQLGEAAGGEAIGCSLYELPAGARSWPYHYHAANEEALYVLAGDGAIRIDGQTHSLEAGDYVALPVGETGGHRVINDSDGPLRYLMVSTMNDPDVTVYPDREMIGVFAGAVPGGREGRTVEGFYAIDDTVDYWDDTE